MELDGAAQHVYGTLAVLAVVPTPPYTTTSPGRLLRCTFTPSRAALHTPVSRHAPTGPMNTAMFAQISGREVACSTCQLGGALVAAGGMARMCVGDYCGAFVWLRWS
jgi:hypothetical protein